MPNPAFPSVRFAQPLITSTAQPLGIWVRQSSNGCFMSKDLDLPTDGVSNKEVFLPDNSKLKISK